MSFPHGLNRELLIDLANAGGSPLQSLDCPEINELLYVSAMKGYVAPYGFDVFEVSLHLLNLSAAVGEGMTQRDYYLVAPEGKESAYIAQF